jgi:hypothetical protein
MSLFMLVLTWHDLQLINQFYKAGAYLLHCGTAATSGFEDAP